MDAKQVFEEYVPRARKLPRPVHRTWAEWSPFVKLTGDEYALRSWATTS